MPTKAKRLTDSPFCVRFDVLRDGESVRSEILLGPIIRVGRLTSSGLRIDDSDVDGLHALVEVNSSNDAFVVDLGSLSGTLLNGELVVKARIKNGDRLVFGTTEVEVHLGLGKEITPPTNRLIDLLSCDETRSGQPCGFLYL